VCFYFSTSLSETFFFLRELSEILLKMYVSLHIEYPLFLSNFNATYIFSKEFRKILKYQLDVSGSVHHSTIRKKKSNKMQKCVKIFIIPYLYKVQHVSGDTPPIIRSLKLHWQPLIFHTWKVVGRMVGGFCQAHCA
jgi:hypothetical protein